MPATNTVEMQKSSESAQAIDGNNKDPLLQTGKYNLLWEDQSEYESAYEDEGSTLENSDNKNDIVLGENILHTVAEVNERGSKGITLREILRIILF